MPKQNIKTSLSLTPEALETVQDIARSNGVSMADVIRRAIDTEKFLRDVQNEGAKIIVEGKDKSRREIVFRR
jgi:hypothetical protein